MKRPKIKKEYKDFPINIQINISSVRDTVDILLDRQIANLNRIREVQARIYQIYRQNNKYKTKEAELQSNSLLKLRDVWESTVEQYKEVTTILNLADSLKPWEIDKDASKS